MLHKVTACSQWLSKSFRFVYFLGWGHKDLCRATTKSSPQVFLNRGTAATCVSHNSTYTAADGHSPYIVSCWKWMMVIIDRSKASLTGSSNDECKGSQQVDSIVWYLVSPLLSQRESPVQHPSSAQGNGNEEFFFSVCLSTRYLPLNPPFVCVCVCKINMTVPFHQVLVSATH